MMRYLGQGFVALLLLAVLQPARAQSLVTVTSSLDGPATVLVGQTFSVTVSAQINDPSDPNNGLFTFEQDLILANLTAGPMPLSVLWVMRPGADDLLSGPDADGAIVSDGVQDIYGGYLDDTLGIGSSKVLFTAQLEAIAPGEARIVAGPNTSHYGDDLILYDGTSPGVVYAEGPLVTVVVPEPGSTMLAAASVLMLFRRRRRARL